MGEAVPDHTAIKQPAKALGPKQTKAPESGLFSTIKSYTTTTQMRFIL